MGSHSRFAPSSFARIVRCKPSFLLNESLPDRSSPDAEHGTAAHYIRELCLNNDQDTVAYAGCVVAVRPEDGECRFVHEKAPLREDEHAYEVDDEMVNAVQSTVDWTRELPGKLFVEVRVDHTPWCPDVDEWGEPTKPQKGTSDDIVIDEERKRLTTTDLKYGKGVKVYAEENEQAIAYSLGAINDFGWVYGIDDSWTIVIRIAQPRLDHFDVWETTYAHLMQRGAEIKAALTEVFNPDAPFNPGEKQCKFCKASARCKALHEYVLASKADAFGDVRMLTDEELAEAYKKRKLFESHFNAIEREVGSLLRTGAELPGLKLVPARTLRQWKDETEARAALLAIGLSPHAIDTRKLISPNQAEALTTKEKHEKLAELWEKPQGGVVIALADDKREAINTGFDVIDDGFGDL